MVSPRQLLQHTACWPVYQQRSRTASKKKQNAKRRGQRSHCELAGVARGCLKDLAKSVGQLTRSSPREDSDTLTCPNVRMVGGGCQFQADYEVTAGDHSDKDSDTVRMVLPSARGRRAGRLAIVGVRDSLGDRVLRDFQPPTHDARGHHRPLPPKGDELQRRRQTRNGGPRPPRPPPQARSSVRGSG